MALYSNTSMIFVSAIDKIVLSVISPPRKPSVLARADRKSFARTYSVTFTFFSLSNLLQIVAQNPVFKM